MHPTLLKQLAQNRLSHAYLLVANRYSMNSPVIADELFRLLKVAPVDRILLDREEEKVKIEDIRVLERAISLAPVASPTRLAVILHAECLTPEAQNALLKTLEEPPSQATVILVTAIPQKLLPTILSRVTTLRIKGEQDLPAVVPLPIIESALYERMELAKRLADDSALLEILDNWTNQLRRGIVEQPECSRRIGLVFEARHLLETNANPRLVLENMLLDWEEQK